MVEYGAGGWVRTTRRSNLSLPTNQPCIAAAPCRQLVVQPKTAGGHRHRATFQNWHVKFVGFLCNHTALGSQLPVGRPWVHNRRYARQLRACGGCRLGSVWGWSIPCTGQAGGYDSSNTADLIHRPPTTGTRGLRQRVSVWCGHTLVWRGWPARNYNTCVTKQNSRAVMQVAPRAYVYHGTTSGRHLNPTVSTAMAVRA